MTGKIELRPGLVLHKGYLPVAHQRKLVSEVMAGLEEAPLFQPVMPRTGKPFSVRMSNFGPLGWVADVKGYRYQPRHPRTGAPWPQIPESLMDLWSALAAFEAPPEACLVNHYTQEARMGLHQDRDESEFSAPVLSVSLGDEALFRFKGESRTGRSASIRLSSGDVVVMGGESRLAYHGIDRIYPGSSALLADTPLASGRINLTLRRVNPT